MTHQWTEGIREAVEDWHHDLELLLAEFKEEDERELGEGAAYG